MRVEVLLRKSFGARSVKSTAWSEARNTYRLEDRGPASPMDSVSCRLPVPTVTTVEAWSRPNGVSETGCVLDKPRNVSCHKGAEERLHLPLISVGMNWLGNGPGLSGTLSEATSPD